MAAIGKRRDGGQKRKRRESGIRAVESRSPLPPEALPRVSSPSSPDVQSRERIGNDAAEIERLLDETSQRLGRMTVTPLRRELELVVDRYRRTAREWASLTPTPVQRTILLDCVKGLHTRVVSRMHRGPPAR